MDARLRISATATAGEYLAELWDQGFPATGVPALVSGTFALGDLGAGLPARQNILKAVRQQTNPDPAFQAAGIRLFGLLQNANVHLQWLSLLRQKARTYLELDPGVEELPWELLCLEEPGGLVNRYFARPQSPIFRTHRDAGRALGLELPIRILVVTGEPAPDATQVPGNHIGAIRKKFAVCPHSVHLEVMQQPALNDLAAMLDELRPQVFFFVGHGSVSPYTNKPALVFGPDNAPLRWWDSDDIYQQLSSQDWAPRLVVLNACESAHSGSSMAAVSSAFARGGALAVIGNQATVTETHALELAERLCRHLVQGTSLDAAFAQIRNSLGQMPNGWSRRDWALPVLSVAVPPDQVLAFPAAPASVRNCAVLGVFQRVQGANPFIGRIDARREMAASLRPFAPGKAAANCIVVEGPEGVGKSWLVKRYERDFASAGPLVRHCELAGLQGLDFVGVLERILNGDAAQPNSLVHQPLPALHFEDFVSRAAEYRAGNQDPASIRRVCDAFRSGLERASEPDGLLIVLDQFHRDGGGGIAPEAFQLGLLNDFVVPIANGAHPRVRLVLILRTGDSAAYGLDRVVNARSIALQPFLPDQFSALFLEFCRFERSDDLDYIEKYWYLKLAKNRNSWLPGELQRTREDVEIELRRLM